MYVGMCTDKEKSTGYNDPVYNISHRGLCTYYPRYIKKVKTEMQHGKTDVEIETYKGNYLKPYKILVWSSDWLRTTSYIEKAVTLL